MADELNARFRDSYAQLRRERPDMDQQTAAHIAKTVVLDNQAKEAKSSQLHKGSPGGPNIRVETSTKPTEQMIQIGGHGLTLNQRLQGPGVGPGGDGVTMRNQEVSMDPPNLATQNYTVPLPSTGLGSERYRQLPRPTQLPAAGRAEPNHTRNLEQSQQEIRPREPYPPSADHQASTQRAYDKPHLGQMRTEARLPSEFHPHPNGQIPQTHVPLDPPRRNPLNDLPTNVFNNRRRYEAPLDRPTTDIQFDPFRFAEEGNNNPPPPYNDESPLCGPHGTQTQAEPEIVEPPPRPSKDRSKPHKTHAKKGKTPKSETGANLASKFMGHVRRHI